MGRDGIRLLVVDDHRDTVDVLCRVLGARGLVCTPAYTLAEAVAHCAAGRFDVVMTDVRLADGDGTALIALACAPVIALSAHVQPDDVRRGLDAGFCAYLTKPAPLDRLLTGIDYAMSVAGEPGKPLGT